MSENPRRMNPTLAIATQTSDTARRHAVSSAQALRARFEAEDRIYRSAIHPRISIGTGIPAVCTIH